MTRRENQQQPTANKRCELMGCDQFGRLVQPDHEHTGRYFTGPMDDSTNPLMREVTVPAGDGWDASGISD